MVEIIKKDRMEIVDKDPLEIKLYRVLSEKRYDED